MIKNYLLISFRSLRKHFSYSLINILGLGLGLATCLLLVTWIRDEVSFDRFHDKAERIYRFSLEYGNGGQTAATSVSPTALLPAILSLPEAETGTRYYKVSGRNPWIVRYEENSFRESRFYIADSTFFDVFSFPLLKGNPKEALRQPYSVVLTESIARKYFGNEDPLGKLLKVNNKREYVVTGVVADLPANSLFRFELLGSFTSLPQEMLKIQWWSANYQTFVLVKENADADALEAKTNDIVKKEIPPSGDGDYVKYNKMALTDIYLKSPFSNEPEVVSDIRYVYIFSAVAALILLIACINYINLATAKAADRAKEVGIRKVVGALRNQLFVQFIGESVLITFFAFVFAFFLSQLLLPLFNELTGKQFAGSVLLEPSFLLVSIVTLLIIAVLAGAYPAFAITSFKPVTVLKGNFKTSGRGIWLRKGLVVFQFAISIVLITGTIIIVKQLDYIQGKNLGYDKEHVIHLPLDSLTEASYSSFKNELQRTGTAVEVARGSESPVQIQAGYTINTKENSGQGVVTTGLLVDHSYLPAVGLELLYGRNFTEGDWERHVRDTAYTFILNESAVRALFLEPAEAVGKIVVMGGRQGEIIGVAKDFHFNSLHREINPLVIFQEDQFSKVFIRLPEGNVEEHVSKVKETYTKLYTHRPFEFQFLDEQYESLYNNEQRLGSVFIVFATLAIIIACLGLLGLVSFSAAQKTKEIGIRKVMGATPASIVMLITSDFTKLVLISIVLGLPLAYWIMQQWLSAFAYKTDIGVTPLLVASAVAFVIALGTAGYQAVKAALVDPAKTLRNE
ncbi:MAG TPA: ABC transporter permease [Chryseosolibacter sp.]